MPRKSDENYSEKETVERRDAALSRALSTPPKPKSANTPPKTERIATAIKQGVPIPLWMR